MTDYLDGLPLGPVLLFLSGYLVLLLTVLAWFKARRHVERCDRCGAQWKTTGRGNSWHMCNPTRRLS